MVPGYSFSLVSHGGHNGRLGLPVAVKRGSFFLFLFFFLWITKCYPRWVGSFFVLDDSKQRLRE